MAEIPKSPSEVVRQLHLTIVDIVGALLPGLVWFVLLATLLNWPAGTPVQAALWLLAFGKEAGNAFYAAVGLLSVLLGWVIKSAGLDWAEFICAFPAWWFSAERGALKWRDFRFPYTRVVEARHGRTMEEMIDLATRHLGISSHCAPGKQPFEVCKVVVRQSDAGFAEAAERAEAQVALLGSLFLASVFSFLCAVSASIPRPHWWWVGASLAAAFFFGYSFHKDRRAEVDRTYYMALMVAERARASTDGLFDETTPES